MTEPRLLRKINPFEGYSGLAAGFKARIGELEVAMEEVDARAGLPLRYTSKMLGRNQSKNLGTISLGPLMGALGLELWLMVVDDAPPGLPKRGKRGPNAHEDAHTRKLRFKRLNWAKLLLTSSRTTRKTIATLAAVARWQKHRQREKWREQKRAYRRKVRDKLMGAAVLAPKGSDK